MEPLDLDTHSPEEYENKTLFINGILYQISDYLYTGKEKFVFRLINERSNLACHVVKIFRSRGFDGELRNTLEWQKLFFAHLPFVRTIPIKNKGYLIEIEPVIQVMSPPFTKPLSFCEDMKYPTGYLMSDAEDRMKSDLEEASNLFHHVLKINPNHTQALYNIGNIYDQQKRYDMALFYFLQALEIEPNLEHYYIRPLTICLETNSNDLAFSLYYRLKSIFPSCCDFDSQGINLAIRCGEPEKTYDLLDRALLMEEPLKMDIRKNVEIELKNKIESYRLYQIFLNSEKNTSTYFRIELLEKSYNLNPRDRNLAGKIAIALCGLDQYVLAKKIFESLVNRESFDLVSIYSIMLAFCEISLKNYSAAANILDIVMEYLKNHYNADRLYWQDIPGFTLDIAYTPEGRLVNVTDYRKATSLIKELKENYTLSNNIEYLLSLYEEAYSKMEYHTPASS